MPTSRSLSAFVFLFLGVAGCDDDPYGIRKAADQFAEDCASGNHSVAPAEVQLARDSVTLTELDQTIMASAIVFDVCGGRLPNAPVTWSATSFRDDGIDVVTVSSDGLVTAVADGDGNVTATSGAATSTIGVQVQVLFSLAENGVTVLCPDAEVGYTGAVNRIGSDGIVGAVHYTKRSRAGLDSLAVFEVGGGTCTTGVTDLSDLFEFTPPTRTRLNWLDLSSWDVSGVTDMSGMFAGAEYFDQDISAWDVSSVTAMDSMFAGAATFNRDLSGWCVVGIVDAPAGFDGGATSWTAPRPVWGTCP